jgi:hypothetical protein
MGCVGGVFHPEIAYPKIRSVAQEFFDLPQGLALLEPHSNEKWKQYHAKFDALNIKVVDADGIALDPVGGFYIADFPIESPDSICIGVQGLQRHELEKYFEGS